jgi:hypothetical protein
MFPRRKPNGLEEESEDIGRRSGLRGLSGGGGGATTKAGFRVAVAAGIGDNGIFGRRSNNVAADARRFVGKPGTRQTAVAREIGRCSATDQVNAVLRSA